MQTFNMHTNIINKQTSVSDIRYHHQVVYGLLFGAPFRTTVGREC